MIVDTNFILSFITGSTNELRTLVLSESLGAPEFIKAEMLNVLRKMHYLHQVPITQIEKYYINAIQLIDDFYPQEEILPIAKKISFDLNHPIYDCLFLASSIIFEKSFISYDIKLLEKAQKLGISVIYP